jgi:flagellar basal-body rod protein FlgB
MTGITIPLLDALRSRMSWLNSRQAVLSQNVAQADMPGYQPRELKPLDFASVLKHAQSPSAGALVVTDPHHISVGTPSDVGGVAESDVQAEPGEPSSIEDEMMKVADTQAQYQAAVGLYAKAMGMMRTAIDRNGN